jgi:hypothetical protein
MIWETKAQTDRIVDYLKGKDDIEKSAQAGHGIKGMTTNQAEAILGPKPTFLKRNLDTD